MCIRDRVALRGQAPGFDRVGQDHRRPIGDLVGGGEGFQQVTEVVTTEVAQAGGDGGIVEVAEQPAEAGAVRARAGHRSAQLARR